MMKKITPVFFLLLFANTLFAQQPCNDDVVMVTNSTDKQTCMQVVCEGGDARTLYCSANCTFPSNNALHARKLIASPACR